MIGVVGLAGWYVYKTYMLGSGLNFLPLGVTEGGNGLLVTIGAQNPTNSTATLTSFSGNLYANGSAIANVSNFTPVTIMPNAQTSLNFNVAPNWIGISSQLISQAENGIDTDIAFKLMGTANVNGTPIPVSINF